MTRNLSVKFILAGLWLLCYFPFKQAFVEGEGQKVSLRLGELQIFDNASTQERWRHCLTYLDDHDINCSIRVKCGTDKRGDSKFGEWLVKLELAGHQIIHDELCFCGGSSSLSTYPMQIMPQLVSLRPSAISLAVPYLQLSQPSDFFRNQFRSLARQSNHLTIEGDPTNWGQQQFRHFEENIQYLLINGIKFDVRP